MKRRTAIAAAPLLLGAGCGRGRGDAAPAARRRAGGKVLRYAFVVAETGFDPAQDQRPLFAHRHRAHLRGAVPLRLPGAAGRRCVPHAAAAMPEIGDDFRTWTIRIRPGIYFADDPAFKGKPRELVAADYVYALEALLRSGQQEPELHRLRGGGRARPRRAARGGDQDKKPFDYDTPGRRLARARSLHAAVQARRAAPALSLHARRREHLRRGGARGRRVLRRQHRRASGRHRAVPPGAVAAQLAHRARAQPELPRGPLRRRARRRRRRGPGAAAPASRAAAADDRPGRDLDHRGEPAALAGLPQRRDRPARCRCRSSSPTQAVPGGKLAPYLAKRGVADGPLRQRRPHALLLQHGGSGRRRLHARQGGAAPRHQPGDRRRREITQVRRGQAIPAQSIVAPGGSATTRPIAARTATTTRRAPRPCSTCTATSIATATAGASCPTASRW